MSKPIDQELLPCPFCGDTKPNLTHDDYIHQDGRPMAVVECTKCHTWVQAEAWSKRVQPAGVVVPGIEKLREVWLFLDGQGELDGMSFGEAPDGTGRFWWRKHLRAALEPIFAAAPHPVSAEQNPRPTGLSRGWNLTRQVDGFVIGHSSEEPSEKSKAQAIHDGYIYVPFLVGATPPAAQDVDGLVEALEACRNELLNMIDKHNVRDESDGSWLYDHQTVCEADAALAAHRAQRGEQS